MSNYTKLTDFASKDSLPTGSPAKIVKGTEIDDELQAIENAIVTKADINSPALTGTPTAPTAALGTNTTQVATTAYVQSELTDLDVSGQIATAVAGINVDANTITLNTNWVVEGSGTDLLFKYSGVTKMKLDSSGNLTVVGNVTAYGTV